MNELERDVAGSLAAHRALEADLEQLTDAAVRAPSLLPDWSVAHVLAHIARNAESFTRLLLAAQRGEVTTQYPGGREQRNGDIEAGATRDAAAIVADVRGTNATLAATYASMSSAAWDNPGETMLGPVVARELPFRRWRETVVHHADLGLGFTWRDWPADYVRIELQRMTMLWDARAPMGLTGLPAAALAVDEHTRLAWLMGRTTIEGLDPAQVMG